MWDASLDLILASSLMLYSDHLIKVVLLVYFDPWNHRITIQKTILLWQDGG